jgi:hypothetical protein
MGVVSSNSRRTRLGSLIGRSQRACYNLVMPAISPPARRFLTMAAFYFVLGLLLQALNLFDAWLGFNPFAITTGNASRQVWLVGWTSQLGLALIYDRWLPSATKARPVFWLLNLGLLLSLAGQPGWILILRLLAGQLTQLVNLLGQVLGFGSSVGGLLQLAAGGLFAWELGQAIRAR